MHDGVITLRHAQLAGLHKDAVRRRVLAGHWRRLFPGVFFADDRPFTPRARIRAAVWSYGPDATASGLAAAWWHGLVEPPPDIAEVTIPRTGNGRSHPGTRLRRRDLKATDVVERHGLRVTSVELTAIEAAVRPGGGPTVMDRALQRHTELSPLWRTHVRNKGRYGSPRARILLQAAGDNAHSHAERLLIKELKNAGITGWVANCPVGPYVVDIAFPGPQDRNRGRRLRLPHRRRGIPARPEQAELPGAERLADPSLHLARPRRTPRTRDRRDPPSDFGVIRRAQRARAHRNHSARVTQRWRMPVCRLLRVHSTGRTTSTDENRGNSSSNSTRSSSRARLAPRQ